MHRLRQALAAQAAGPAAYQATLVQVNALEPAFLAAPDADLHAWATELRAAVAEAPSDAGTIARLFALVREAARRTLGLRLFDVQILGGLALYDGKIVEMGTGEGKTLAAVAPVALHALRGGGVHVLTFNDYLARRDAEWMGPVYRRLGLRVGVVQEGMSPADRRAAYAADVTYATAKEAGFDFLRDALVLEPGDAVHRPFNVALVDEADSIMIDEARVPLVVAGSTQAPRGEAERLAGVARQLDAERDYAVDRERRTVHLTDAGLDHAEALLGRGSLHTAENVPLLSELNTALYAAALMRRDVDYIVRHGRVEIVDEFTGRVVEDRHWPDGLQAAIEVKEGVRRSAEGRVLGQITLQHFLKQYPRLCGMTATARPAAEELRAVYDMCVQVIPPNRPCIRVDHPDVVFTHREAKLQALVAEIAAAHAAGRPVLVGTLHVEESEGLAARLRAAGIVCNVLNAKRDDQEARLIAEAGRPGAVTISTNMAGRGTDIRLGGAGGAEAEQVAVLGGLYVIGTNRHETRRVDDQLRGRAGRQGDPGSSRFFVSLEDDLLQRDDAKDILPAKYRPVPQPGPVDNPVIRQGIVRAQRMAETHNGDLRRGLWHYARVVEEQRRVVAAERQRVLRGEVRPEILARRAPEDFARLRDRIGADAAAAVERRLTLLALDECWADHLATVADIREGIHLVAVGGMVPLEEFRKAAVRSFKETRDGFEDRVVERLLALPVAGGGVDLMAVAPRGPSATWTYLLEEDLAQDPLATTIASSRNIGMAIGAAATGPLLLLWALVERFRKRRAP